MLTQKVRTSLFRLLRRKNTKNCGVKFPAIKGKQTKKKVGDQHLERFLKDDSTSEKLFYSDEDRLVLGVELGIQRLLVRCRNRT